MGERWGNDGFRNEKRQKEIFKAVTLYVDNLPKALHWQGLWHIFAQHGDVVDSVNKLNRGGRRFGFVRFEREVDADRAKERLNGLLVYGCKIFVGLARYNKSSSGWGGMKSVKKCGEMQENISDNDFSVQKKQDIPIYKGKESVKEGVFGCHEKRNQKVFVPRKIQGHVVDEQLWELKRCLVGVMATVCKTSSIISRLQSWGLGEIQVKSMGGKRFLLSFTDDELFTMLEDLEWSYLKEIFVEVFPWTENLIQMEGATWLELSGMPLHCWNQCTFKRVAELWGSFEALGENAFRSKNCEKVTILITTNQVERIDEIVEIEVGNLIFKVRVMELGFSDESPELQPTRVKSSVRTNCDKDGSSSGSSSESKKTQSPAKSDWCWTQVEEEALEAILLGKDHSNDEGMLGKEDDRHLGDVDLLGCSPIKVSADNDNILKGNSIDKEGQGVICGTAGIDGKPSCVEVVSKQLEEINDSLIKEIEGKESASPTVKKDLASSKLLVYNQNMGLKPFSSEFKPSPNSSWAATVDERMNASYIKSGAADSCNLKQCGAQSEEGEAMSFFPELAYLKRKKKDRRYGSLLEFQDKVISDLERKKKGSSVEKAQS
ncbi:hypothetical protein GQ457_02G030320 [Hibiscus cannabinus]